MSRKPARINFETYTDAIPTDITDAVSAAANRVLINRGVRINELDDWEGMRQAASDLRMHTLLNLDHYLKMVGEQVEHAGGHVHWANDAEEARQTVLNIAQKHDVKTVVKVKSMATEEISLNDVLQSAGIQASETDLGEYIIQLAGTGPSHIIIPAIHLKKEEIAELFHSKLGVDAPPEAEALTAVAREQLRKKFLQADMGISGANFLIAETGTLIIVSNEGNGRFCTTLPDLHVAVVGIDKVIPDWESAGLLLRMLARSATGQKITAYNTFITGPRREEGEFGAKEFHLVLLDNGRSRILADPVGRETLKCIRCGCCLNACPIYKNVGGFAYGWFISGPIGAIFTPQILGTRAAAELPFASSLCGACVEVCPVKVPFTQILLHLRRRVVDGDQFSEPVLNKPARMAASIGQVALGWGWLYRFGTALLPWFTAPLTRKGWINKLPPPFSRWTKVRPFPAFIGGFRGWWHKKLTKGNSDEYVECN
jgi:L-lactate dehydrogenase complex protein LldF